VVGAIDNLQATLDKRHDMLGLSLTQAQKAYAGAAQHMEALDQGLENHQALLDQAVKHDKELGKVLAAMGNAGDGTPVGACCWAGWQVCMGIG
jgi:ABC-type transporter Mla subunit MlaD